MFTSLAIAAADHVGPFYGGFGWLFFLIPLFWIGLFVLIASLFGRRWRRAGWGPGGQYGPWAAGSTHSAEASLAERFAQGDIDETEYRARLEVLKANRPGPTPPR